MPIEDKSETVAEEKPATKKKRAKSKKPVQLKPNASLQDCNSQAKDAFAAVKLARAKEAVKAAKRLEDAIKKK